MTERGMIFNSEMVRAILDGRKTQTRRPVKFPVHDKNLGCELAGNELAGELSAGNYLNSAFGKPGDRIWVRETWQAIHDYCDENGHVDERRYARSIPRHSGNYWHPVYEEAWGNESREDREFPWRPSIHMPRWASRILLEITDVRVERLNAISEEDAQREGVHTEVWDQTVVARNYAARDEFFQFWSEDMPHYVEMNQLYRSSFRSLWESIYGEEGWKANGWVWVIEFKRVEGGAA
ncbi:MULTISPECIES: ASCH domain-containing protein [Klebsiella pneumoniae complex]|uniref:hypothetical protein n=1 Tax=Klebsiella pneumoniae complex TaxID=3390273 RepID=UPI00190E748F|nr:MULTISPECIES: hypothetical protein [Klebsiella]MCZ9597546.1 hypothetical protein [Klebsiella quasipneumoniae]